MRHEQNRLNSFENWSLPFIRQDLVHDINGQNIRAFLHPVSGQMSIQYLQGQLSVIWPKIFSDIRYTAGYQNQYPASARYPVFGLVPKADIRSIPDLYKGELLIEKFFKR